MVRFILFCCPFIIVLLLVQPCLANRIDSLKSDEEVLAFLPQFFPDFQRGFSFEYKINHTLRGDSLSAHNWFTTDIDKNGETDLLVFRLRYGPEIFAILSEKGKFKKIIGDYSFGADFIYPVLKRINNRNAIFLYNLNQIAYDTATHQEVTTPLKCDTLVVLRNCFVNYIKSPIQYKIEKIEISSDGACEGYCPKIDEVIYPQELKSKCTKTEWWNRGKKHFGKLTVSQISDILYLLNNSNFSRLKSYYRIRSTDNTTTTITITYNGGKKKTISDYGLSGNFTLVSIYRIAFNVNWKEGSS